MNTPLPVAIIGGGPAGALAAATLAERGRRALLFDEKLAWEKPCGGGLTHKALQQYPFLAEAGSAVNTIDQCELIGPSGQRVRFRMRHPVAILSRFALNGFLLDRARKSGADVRHERITRAEGSPGNWRLLSARGEYRASFLLLAAGARNPLRTQFLPPISSDDLVVTAGYFIPGQFPLIQIQFLKEASGYIWVFPRPDHASVGIAGKMGELPTRQLRCLLEEWIAANGYSLEGASFYSHILPSFRSPTLSTLQVSGDGWAMIGDSAGLVDPITGEGLYYALRSAELCAEALLADRPERYPARLHEEIVPELALAARVSHRFYRGRVFGGSVLERMIALTAHSPSFRDLMSDLFAGTQGYSDLKARLYRILPAVMTEGLGSSLAPAWLRSGKLAIDVTPE